MLGDKTGVLVALSPDRGDIEGLQDFLLAACGAAASRSDDAFAVLLSRLLVSFLTPSERRDLREKVWCVRINKDFIV